MTQRPVLQIPKGGLCWETERKLYARTGTWSPNFVELYLRVGHDDEKRPPPELVAECKAARAEYLRAKEEEGRG